MSKRDPEEFLEQFLSVGFGESVSVDHFLRNHVRIGVVANADLPEERSDFLQEISLLVGLIKA